MNIEIIKKRVYENISIISDKIELLKNDLIIHDNIKNILEIRIEIEWYKGFIEGLNEVLRIIKEVSEE